MNEHRCKSRDDSKVESKGGDVYVKGHSQAHGQKWSDVVDDPMERARDRVSS